MSTDSHELCPGSSSVKKTDQTLSSKHHKLQDKQLHLPVEAFIKMFWKIIFPVWLIEWTATLYFGATIPFGRTCSWEHAPCLTAPITPLLWWVSGTLVHKDNYVEVHHQAKSAYIVSAKLVILVCTKSQHLLLPFRRMLYICSVLNRTLQIGS